MDKRSIGFIGLEEHLNATKEDHGDKGYDDFVEMVNLKVAIVKIAEAFKVDRRTIYKWIDLL